MSTPGHELSLFKNDVKVGSFYFPRYDEAIETLQRLYEGMMEYGDQGIKLMINMEEVCIKDVKI